MKISNLFEFEILQMMRDLITFPCEKSSLIEFGKDGKIGNVKSSLGQETTAQF